MNQRPIRSWQKSPREERMYSIHNRYLSRFILATTGLVVLSSFLTTTEIVAKDYHFLFLFRMGSNEFLFKWFDDNPVSLSGVKAGHLLSTVSQEVWLQGEGRSFSLLSSQGDGELQEE